MNLSELAVKRPVATGAILVLILVIGLVSLFQSPLDLLPDIQAPLLAIITAFPGSSPQETLELVTKPIEEGVSAVSGLVGINSISQENLSLIILRLDWGSDVKRLREEVNVRMDLLTLPDGVQRPILLEFDPTLMPIMQVS
ncbi:MAG: efflux RND transporter permease subunit, partial [Clostridia bacterium]|nr:efflux RND transporter permease subunit [Clostridia bacterium]